MGDPWMVPSSRNSNPSGRAGSADQLSTMGPGLIGAMLTWLPFMRGISKAGHWIPTGAWILTSRVSVY